MNRRGFMGALAGATATLLALPKVFARDGVRIREGGESRFIFDAEGIANHPLSAIENGFNRAAGKKLNVVLSLRKTEDTDGILGTVASTTSSHHARFCVILRSRAFDGRAHWQQVVRQVKYQAQKSAESVEYTRRTGYVMRMVDREGHRLHHRIYWQHETTGRIRWSQPA